MNASLAKIIMKKFGAVYVGDSRINTFGVWFHLLDRVLQCGFLGKAKSNSFP